MDSILPELILHAVSALKSWFSDFLTSCMHQLKIPKIWRRTLIVAIPTPEKPHRSVLEPLLFDIYISDLPNTTSRKYAYADDLAIMHADGD